MFWLFPSQHLTPYHTRAIPGETACTHILAATICFRGPSLRHGAVPLRLTLLQPGEANGLKRGCLCACYTGHSSQSRSSDLSHLAQRSSCSAFPV